MNGIVFDVQRFSLHDGPGIRTTVFLKGCRLRCKWCQNPEGLAPRRELIWWDGKCVRCGRCVEVCPESALSIIENRVEIDRDACTLCGRCVTECPHEALTIVGKEMSVEEVLAVVKRDAVFYETSGGGMTLSGGDPSVQAEFSAELLKACRSVGIHTAVETGMLCDWLELQLMLPHTDLFLLDLKIMDPVEHRRWTGHGNRAIKENFERICAEPVKKVVRIALVPEMTGTESNVLDIARYVASVDRNVPIELLNFNPLCRAKYEKLGRDFPVPSAKMFSDEQMAGFRQIIRDAGAAVYGESSG